LKLSAIFGSCFIYDLEIAGASGDVAISDQNLFVHSPLPPMIGESSSTPSDIGYRDDDDQSSSAMMSGRSSSDDD
jgi:hypothetical protein